MHKRAYIAFVLGKAFVKYSSSSTSRTTKHRLFVAKVGANPNDPPSLILLYRETNGMGFVRNRAFADKSLCSSCTENIVKEPRAIGNILLHILLEEFPERRNAQKTARKTRKITHSS